MTAWNASGTESFGRNVEKGEVIASPFLLSSIFSYLRMVEQKVVFAPNGLPHCMV